MQISGAHPREAVSDSLWWDSEKDYSLHPGYPGSSHLWQRVTNTELNVGRLLCFHTEETLASLSVVGLALLPDSLCLAK